MLKAIKEKKKKGGGVLAHCSWFYSRWIYNYIVPIYNQYLSPLML